MSQFVHLHVHTQYSLLEGAATIKKLVERAVQFKMPALAITDSNNLFGAIDFYKNCKAAGIKPIIGCEVLWSADPLSRSGPHHLVLLCKDLDGYRNLCQLLTSASLTSAAEARPRVTRELLKAHAQGLIALSGCLRGEIASQILSGNETEARTSIAWFRSIFGADFYLELQDTGMPEQDHVNEIMFQLGRELNVEVVGTTDCHYLEPEDAPAQEILQSIGMGKNIDIDRPASLVPSEFYFKPPEVMIERLARFQGAVENTLKIAEKCNLAFNFTDPSGQKIYHLPNFRPEGVGPGDPFDVKEYLKKQAREGLSARLGERACDDPGKYAKRLDDEIEMIIRTGFAGYFLIVADFINWAKNNGIPVGPGRGSGAGSLVSYALRITDLDPIEFNLLFERFINPERVSMPDFDVDFCQDRRGEVIDYVTRKYGKGNVCQIITFGKLQARQVLKDVGRVLGMSFAETDQITKSLPRELNIKLQKVLEEDAELRQKVEADARLKKLVEYSLKLEGLYRNAGVHAAGVIITEEPIVNYCPLYVGSEGVVVSQFDKDFAEEIGLVKFDFLGLKTLTVIDSAVKLIGEGNSAGLPRSFNDPKVYELIGSGDTDGVFQVESSGMKDLCARLQPGSLEDLTAINALYRPGPLGSGMVDDFIDRKHGRKPIEYELPELESILKDTYGVILYQEQVMQIARELAGYTLGQADMLRRAMGKKKAEEMARHKEIFCKGAEAKGFARAKAQTIFDLMEKFAEYGFNKSHSAAYAVLTYQTAHLKCHFPAEFMAALMTTEMQNTDKLARYISDARSHGIPVLPPDINCSGKSFSVDSAKAVRFGLEAIKGVGGIAVDLILEARKQGPFTDLFDFARRVSSRKVNKKVWEAMIYSGALDTIAGVGRATLSAALDSLLEYASDAAEEQEIGQVSLFDQFKAEDIKLVTPAAHILKTQPDWGLAKKLTHEKEVMGIYVSGHPLDSWQLICDDWLGWNTKKLRQYNDDRVAKGGAALQGKPREGGGWRSPPKKTIEISGMIASVKEITTKKGTRMAFVEIEDLYGKVEAILFPDTFQALQPRLKQWMDETEPLHLSAEVEVKEEGPKLFIQAAKPLSEAHRGRTEKVILTLVADSIRPEQLRELKQSLLAHRGKCPVIIYFTRDRLRTTLELASELQVKGTPQFAASVNKIFGTPVVRMV